MIIYTVYMEFGICFKTAKYEKDMFTLCRHLMCLLMLFAIPKFIFISQDCLN